MADITSRVYELLQRIPQTGLSSIKSLLFTTLNYVRVDRTLLFRGCQYPRPARRTADVAGAARGLPCAPRCAHRRAARVQFPPLHPRRAG